MLLGLNQLPASTSIRWEGTICLLNQVSRSFLHMMIRRTPKQSRHLHRDFQLKEGTTAPTPRGLDFSSNVSELLPFHLPSAQSPDPRLRYNAELSFAYPLIRRPTKQQGGSFAPDLKTSQCMPSPHQTCIAVILGHSWGIPLQPRCYPCGRCRKVKYAFFLFRYDETGYACSPNQGSRPKDLGSTLLHAGGVARRCILFPSPVVLISTVSRERARIRVSLCMFH